MNPGRWWVALTGMDLTVLLALVVFGFLGLMLGLQAVIRLRSRAMVGKTAPSLPGAVSHLSSSNRALLYFFSPGCAACRPLTPRVKELERHNSSVVAIDVTQHLDVARALKVMATPSAVELERGVIVGYHVGPIPEAVMARFA